MTREREEMINMNIELGTCAGHDCGKRIELPYYIAYPTFGYFLDGNIIRAECTSFQDEIQNEVKLLEFIKCKMQTLGFENDKFECH